MSPEDVQADRAAIAREAVAHVLCRQNGHRTRANDPHCPESLERADAILSAIGWPAALDDIDALRAERDALRNALAETVELAEEGLSMTESEYGFPGDPPTRWEPQSAIIARARALLAPAPDLVGE